MKKAHEMTREELEQAYNDLRFENTRLLGENITLKKQYNEKPTYAAEYSENLEKVINLRFASRVLCGLTAPLLVMYSRLHVSNLTASPQDYLLSVGIWAAVGAVICFFSRGISEAEFTRILGVDIVKSKWITPLFIIVGAILFALS